MDTKEELEQSLQLEDYFYVIVKHKWLIAACLIIIVTLTMAFTFQMKPVYQASNTMVIESNKTKSPLSGEMLEVESFLSQTRAFNTHFKLITSRPVLEQVVKDLKLDRIETEKIEEINPFKAYFSKLKENIRLLIGIEEKRLVPQDRFAVLVNMLASKINIKDVRDTTLLKINVQDHDPVMAAKIANTLANVYIKFNIDNRLESSQNTLSWLTDQLYEAKKKLEDAEAEFQFYKQEEKIFSIEGKQNVITQKIQEFNDSYLKARNNRLELDAKLEQIRRTLNSNGDVLPLRSLINVPLIDTLYQQLLEAEVEFNNLKNVFKPKHPKIIQITARIEETEKKLREEIRKEMENMKAERAVLVSKENVLQKTIADFEQDALDTNKKELRYSILYRNVDTNQKIYDTLLSKMKEADIVGNLDVSNIRIAEEAAVPSYPIKPKKKMNLMIGAVLGIMLGAGLAFLKEYMDRTVYTEEDVQKYLGLPVLSVIPEAELP